MNPFDPTLLLTQELLRRPSITPQDEGCQAHLAQRLAARGFTAQHLPFGAVQNLWVRRGQQAPLIVFAGHTDVVPPGALEGWDSPPFEPTLRDGYLIGRGAADMKASVAAFVTALEDFLERFPNPPCSLALLLTSDEEGPATDGTVRVVQWLREHGQIPDYCLVGEPTSVHTLGDTLKNGRRGSLSGTLTVRGKQGHVAYPHLARNPIHLVAPALTEWTRIAWDEANEHFPATTFQITRIQGGAGAGNVIPGEVVIGFNFRFSTASPEQSLRQRTEALLQRHGLDFSIRWELGAQPFLTGGTTLVRALQSAIGQVTGLTAQASTSGGTSDGRFLITLCPEVVEFGPCNATIHQRNECIAVDDLPRLSAIYRQVLHTLAFPEQPHDAP